MLGITISTTDSKAVYDLESGMVTIEETVSIYEVNDGSLADGVLMADDVLLSAVFGERVIEIKRQYHIIDMMLDVRVGDVVTFNVIRNGERVSVSLTITESCLTEY